MRLHGPVAGMHAHEKRLRDLRLQVEHARQDAVIAALMPYAMPRLPAEILICFDRDQNQILTLPKQRDRRATTARPPVIPVPRRATGRFDHG